ncbi:MAG TPA: hypothetical protein VMS17_09605 [Gemmataceae bacterium]|nr:hypothetical protein [Gemmataceae bacterium]
MRHTAWLTALALATGTVCTGASRLAADEPKGTEVDLDGLKATTPTDWKKTEPSNQFRWMQFAVPKAKGDADDAELVISKGLGGGAEANVARWKNAFKPPTGKSIDDAAKLSDVMIGGIKATYLDVSGTYTVPFAQKPDVRPDYRMLAVYYEGKDNVYTFKLVGPAATVEAAKKGFDDWLKAFK